MDGFTYTMSNELAPGLPLPLIAYKDSLGFWTIGRGCKGPGIVEGTVWTADQEQAEVVRRYDLAKAQATGDLGGLFWQALDDVRQAALTDEAYQLGGAGLDEFHHALSAIRARNWQSAHDALLDSLQDRQTPVRCARNAGMLLTGNWP